MWCADKCLTIGSLRGEASVNFCGVNASTMPITCYQLEVTELKIGDR